MAAIIFIDTGVLCNLLEVPSRCQDHGEVVQRFEEFVSEGCQFVLPLTSLIETGNHISHAGGNRRAAAERYARLIAQIADGGAPWKLNQVEWGEGLLRAFLAGNATGQPVVDWLGNAQMGAGDIAILVERDDFIERSAYKADDVTIWSLEGQLASYE
jgi:hypothetical protein